MSKGRVEVEWVVWCGQCGDWERATGFASLLQAKGYWRSLGWVCTRALGWSCQRCKGDKAQ